MISKAMIKFRSKFQLQIPLQFYRTVEKVEMVDGNDQGAPFSQLSTFWLLFCFFMIEIHAYWIQSYFKLANKIFNKKDIVQE